MIGLAAYFLIPGIVLIGGGFWAKQGHGPGLTRTLSIVAIVLGAACIAMFPVVLVLFVPVSYSE